MNKHFWRTLGITTLVFQIILYKYLSLKTQWIEGAIVPYLFKPLSVLLRIGSSVFPFSAGLVLVYFLSVFLVYLLIRQVIRIKTRKSNLKSTITFLIACLSPIYFVYMILWGFLYYRQSVAYLLAYEDTSPVKVIELKELCESLVEETNLSRSELTDQEIDSASFRSVFQKAPLGFKNLSKYYPFFEYSNRSIKKAAGSSLMAYMGTGGIYTFWSGEANVNAIHPGHDIPEVTLHEMAHQIGFASEDEANYIAWLAGKDHPDRLFRYSARYNVLWRSLRRLRGADSTYADSLYLLISPEVYRDAEISKKIWSSYENPIEKHIVWPVYHYFLKANGDKDGIRSYDRVTDHLIYERRKLKKPA